MWGALIGAAGPVILGLINSTASVLMLWIRAKYNFRDAPAKDGNGPTAAAVVALPQPAPPPK
jgi:hypothetical protein